jgi:WD40 repeat protein
MKRYPEKKYQFVNGFYSYFAFVIVINVILASCSGPLTNEGGALSTPDSADAVPEPELQMTPTLGVVTFPIDAGVPVPSSFSPVVILPENIAQLKEIVHAGSEKLVLFDAKSWDGLLLADTNKGVKLFSQNGEFLADLGKSQRRCSIREGFRYNQPSNIYIGPGGIAVVSLDGVHIFSLDGKTEKRFVPLDKQHVVGGLSLCESSLFYASVSPDMNWISMVRPTVSYSTIEIFSGFTGEHMASVSGENVKLFSSDGQYLLTDNGDNRFVLYQTDDWSQVMLIRLEEYSFDYGFSPSTRYLFYFRESDAAVVFRLPDTNQTLVIKGAKSLWFNKSTDEVGALLSNDRENIHVFDFGTGRESRVEKFVSAQWSPGIMEANNVLTPSGIFDERENYEIGCDFSDSGSYSCLLDGTECRFDMQGERACISSGRQPGIDYGSAAGMAVSPDGKYRLISANSGGVYLLDEITGEEIKMLARVDSDRGSLGAAFSPHGAIAAYVEVKPIYSDGAWLLMGELVFYDVVNDKILQKIKLDLYQGNVRMLAFSPDGKLILVGTFDGKVAAYDASSGELVYEFYPHVGMIADLEFSPDGKWLLTAGGMDETAKIWAIEE